MLRMPHAVPLANSAMPPNHHRAPPSRPRASRHQGSRSAELEQPRPREVGGSDDDDTHNHPTSAAAVAPRDLAIPEGGAARPDRKCGKGFDSTGSMLTNAVREVETMAEVRDTNQLIYAIVEEIGWLSRQADLRRIQELWTQHAINGMFPSRATLRRPGRA
jgi:hypothetical protein